mmetsp:Transcript_24645/g.53165  ORF Transcript_24645/g.53165 Transcript_24645/m.53165 type:complete len:96 (+) Transcript_24645:125-412(+)|eukprot:CAMPEP_0172310156 /NCGR_PEP_ID=MMETSP1058-20130122/11324_1 /TAXON_ID=83371 /ORGANISM="Detonula confervacea, Strain CCMP 353" /LENGTH=95 /DNA_ID=CAMNT_0013022925 /DNA_START=112 /DNA_END=399 /DNA_ORIENTATION=-
MVYINSDGTTSDTRKRKWGLNIIRDFVVGVFDFVGLFFRTLTASPAALESERGQRRTTYSERQGVRRSGGGSGSGGGSNIRGISRLGTARAAAGG